MRVFVALDIPDAVRRALADLVRRLEPACRGARWARVEGIHITLKFIGETPPEKVQRIREELSSIRGPQAMEMNFRGTGFFPNAKHPRVFWAGIEAPPALADLAANIETRMETLGIPREQRLFKPHLTLARFKSEEGLPKLHEALAQLGPQEFGQVRAEEFYLYQSVLKPRGAEYTKLETFRFAEQG